MINKKKIKNMLENYSTVLKKCVSSGGNDVFIVNSMEDIKNKMKNGSYVLQKIIDPYLFISRKFDFRLYILYIREENNYFAYTVKNGFARVGINAYKKNSQDTFITNVISLTKNKIKKQKHFVYYDSIIEHIKKEEKKNIEDDIINCLADIAIKQLPFIIKHNNSFFRNKNKPKYQFWLVGADIILDNNLSPFVLELNAEPGLVSEQNEHNNIMMNYIWENIFLQWMHNKTNCCNESGYFVKLSEKN